MKNSNELKKLITEVVDYNINNKKLLKEMRDIFITKGLNTNIPNQLFSNALDDYKLSEAELMAIASAILNTLHDERFKLSNFFSESEIFDYKQIINIPDERKDFMLFHNVVKLNNKCYHTTITAKECSEIRSNHLVSYYRSLQRSPKLVKTSSGRVIKTISVNKKNIEEIEEKVVRNVLAPTSISFAVILEDNTKLDEGFKFKDLFNGIVGDLMIKPNYDVNSEDYLGVALLDGKHRFDGVCNAYEKSLNRKTPIDYTMGLYIYVFTREEARTFVYDSFQRAETDLDYLNAIKPSDENAFMKVFEKFSKWLGGNIAMTKQEMKIEKNLTEQKILIEAFKKTGVTLEDSIQGEIEAEKIANVVDDILDYILSSKYNNDIQKMKESIFLNKKIFDIYIRFAEIVKNKTYGKLVYNLVEYICNNEEKLKSILRNKQITDEQFNSIINEVI